MNDDKLVAKLRAGHALRVVASDDDRRLIRVCDIAADRIDELNLLTTKTPTYMELEAEVARLRATTRCPAAIRPIEVDGPGPLIQCLYGNGHDGAHQARRGDSDSLYVAWGHNDGDDVVDLVAENERLRRDNESMRIAHSKDVDWNFADDDRGGGWFVQPSVTNEQLRGWVDRLLAVIEGDDDFLTDGVRVAAAEVRTEMEGTDG